MIKPIENLTSLDQFFSQFPRYNQPEFAEDRKKISAAWHIRLESCLSEDEAAPLPLSAAHSLRMTYILAGLEMDADSIICPLLYSEDGTAVKEPKEIAGSFGTSVTELVNSAVKFSNITLYNKNKAQADTICKMFFSMVNDLRVMIILLADRLDKIRYIKDYPAERQKSIAFEIIEIWAPLAQRMGISTVQHELEDLSLKVSNREAFDQIKEVVASKKKEREQFLQDVEKELYKKLSAHGITVKVQSRAKHFWSIYQKMKKRNKAADELYDLLAVRVLCETDHDCYTILGLVHTIWKPLEGRFKDYIAMPKANGYQSLHTTVVCKEGQTLEIQIRTHAMHEVAERGVASHWVYKQRNTHKQVTAPDISFVRQVKLLSEQKFSNDEFLAELKDDLLGDSIYVFTPKGAIIELPKGATAIDFAYRIHSAIGEKIVAAKADGAIIPLSYELKNTQMIEVVTHPHAHPTYNHYQHCRTAKARQKIRAWLQANGQIQTAHAEKEEKPRPAPRPKNGPKEHTEKAPVLKIRVGNTANFLVKFAQCCNPKPNDPISGYVSRGRGLIIHKKGCRNFANIPEVDDRKIEVVWDSGVL